MTITVDSLVAQMVKNLPAMQETWVLSLGWEDLLEEGMATILLFLPGESLWTEEPAGYSPWDSPGKNTGVGCHFLLQGIFQTQESNPGLLHCRQIIYQLS